MKTGKIWGVTEALWGEGIEVHRLEIKHDHHCSWHRHQHKANAFFVFEGILYIERKKDYGLTDVTELLPGDFTVVPAPELHRFVTKGTGCKAIEIYYPMPLSDDIKREDNGGPNAEIEIPPMQKQSPLHRQVRKGAIPLGMRGGRLSA